MNMAIAQQPRTDYRQVESAKPMKGWSILNPTFGHLTEESIAETAIPVNSLGEVAVTSSTVSRRYARLLAVNVAGE